MNKTLDDKISGLLGSFIVTIFVLGLSLIHI